MFSHNRSGRFSKITALSLLLLMTGLMLQAQDGYISAKSFAEAQGIAYQWFPLQKLLVMRQGLNTVRLTVDNPVVIVNGNQTTMPAPPKIQQGQIMVPATALARFFRTSNQTAVLQTPAPKVQAKPTPAPSPVETRLPEPENVKPIAVTPAPIEPPRPVAITPAQTSQDEAILVALRHSVREDHTRIVLEFSNTVTYNSEFKDGLFRLMITGCRNLIPTRRSNPVGRDIEKLDINSGPDRKGLILSFYPKNKKVQPSIETVGGPFRMIISFALGDESLIASATPTLAASSTTNVTPATAEISKKTEPVKMEAAPEINIQVEPALLNNTDFTGRTIIIDAGHGGNDRGFVYPGRPDEKEINLETARHLAACLEKAGFKTALTRNSDSEISNGQRLSIANRHGGDLYISLHVGGSTDTDKSGSACFSYSAQGTYDDANAQGLDFAAIYHEWLTNANTRFDLSRFLAGKINDRLIQHLKVPSRGVQKLPLQQLQFVTIPAVVVETGMLSNASEGKNLISDNYRKAIAQSIANAVVDFFNGIVINQ